MKTLLAPSEFKTLEGIEYFDFEEEFMEENVRCIPMLVRFKLDIIGIKLRLSEWSKFKPAERIQLALMPASAESQITAYRDFLIGLIEKYTQQAPQTLSVQPLPEWGNLQQVPSLLLEKSEELHFKIRLDQWKKLTDLKRFALLKLCRPGHENKNFPKAVLEFGLIEK